MRHAEQGGAGQRRRSLEAAQSRKRGPSVLQRLRAEEEAAAQVAAAASARLDKRRKTVVAGYEAPECSGGMAMKTRAQLRESASGVIAARDRQMALVGKGTYRDAETMAQEQAMGMLAIKAMPKRKKSTLDKSQFNAAFTKWLRTSMHAKARACCV